MHKQMLCGCGCSGLAREDLVFTNVQQVTAWRCPNHRKLQKGTVRKVIITCPECGLKFIKNLMGARTKTYCDPCQKIVSKRKVRAKNKVISRKERKYIKNSSTTNSLWYKDVA